MPQCAGLKFSIIFLFVTFCHDLLYMQHLSHIQSDKWNHHTFTKVTAKVYMYDT